ncbi:MAG: DUF2189 domain-containing protein [Gammaproteobacteria bacterium]|nr:DUF2189 domain-containing protein [Gammaproteobacteria bacterium]
MATKWISMGFSLIFLLIGTLCYITLYIYEHTLIIFPFIAGFMLVAPILVTGYQRVARLLQEDKTPTFKDLVTGISEATPGIWFLTIVLFICYLIWITDALIIYAIYFGVGAIPIDSSLFTDLTLRDQLVSFLIYSGLLGLGMAILGFSISAFSIPLILHQRLSIVSAVHHSVKTVFTNIPLMLRWGFTLASTTLLTLVFALPLLVIVLPVLAFASYAAYIDLASDTGNNHA